MKFLKTRIILVFLCTCQVISVFSQSNNDVNLNVKYKYDAAFGIEYKNLNPNAVLGTNYSGDFITSDLSLTGYLPLKNIPVLQPFARLGLISFNASAIDNASLDEQAAVDRYNNSQFYGAAGIAYKTYLTKQLDFGALLGLGLIQVNYKDLLNEGVVYGQNNFLTELSVPVGINMSYNISINITPTLRYTRHLLEGLDRFDGFSAGLSFGGAFRLGDDPDAPNVKIRSIKAEKIEFPPVFAPMQSYYSQNPVATIKLKNIEKFAIDDVTVSFFQAGFMDTPTQAAELELIKAGETVDIPVPAIFNQQIYTTEGTTPLTGEIIVDYKSNGRLASQKFPVSYDLYDKESLTWDDDNKVGAFITSSDSALRNYSSYVRQTCKDYTIPGFSQELQTAMQIYYALGELGILYQRDPTSPFESAQENPLIVDSISLPRNTLTRATGDCDDLTVLFCSLLESVGIETAFITVPGHIYAAFKTSTSSRDYKLVHPDKDMTINLDGELWVPVEITLIGEADFTTAWRTGIEEFTAYDDNIELRALNRTRKSQEVYRPVVLTEKDLGLQYGEKTGIVNDFKEGLDKIVTLIIDDFENEARERSSKGSYNKLGITCAQLGQYSKAEQAFNSALSMDRNYLPPKINLGNVYFMKGEYQNALRLLHNAENSSKSTGRTKGSSYSSILLSISKCYYELENFDKANEYMNTLRLVDPETANQNSYLASGETGQRAASRSDRNNLLFAEE